MHSTIRLAKHAGTWYTANEKQLRNLLQSQFEKAKAQLKDNLGQVKAIIGPHAGILYSGLISAHAYQYFMQGDPSKKHRIFILGPSHNQYLYGISLSICDELQTPIGSLPVDRKTIEQLQKVCKNQKMSKKQQENQHSLEMHLPYIKKVFTDCSIVPIIVGELDAGLSQELGKILAGYFNQPDTIFIISSDFCHWGRHFKYQPFLGFLEEIPDKIKGLDQEAMRLIEANDIEGFWSYIQKTQNTICGQFPIKLFMSILKHSELKAKTQFVQYAQSDKVRTCLDTSVSYAASVTYLI